MALDGLIVSGIDLKKTMTDEWIEPPRAYSKQFLPMEREQIATPEKIKKWNYLKLGSAIFYQIFIFHQTVDLQKLSKMFFISSKKLFSFLRY